MHRYAQTTDLYDLWRVDAERGQFAIFPAAPECRVVKF